MSAKDGETSRRILIVDDDPINRKLIERMLTALGYDAEAIADGRQVSTRLNEQTYGCILLDYNMPDLDGPAVARAVRGRGDRCAMIPIVGLSASNLPFDRAACLDAGMNDFLSKPVGMSTLQETLDRWLGQGRSDAPPVKPTQERRVLSVEHALRTMGDDQEFFVQMLNDFLGQLATRRIELQSAVISGNREEACRLAHALRGAAAMLGAERLADVLLDLETASRGKGELGSNALDAIDEQIESLRKEASSARVPRWPPTH